MKKIVTLLLTVCLVLSLAACGGEKKQADEAEDQKTIRGVVNQQGSYQNSFLKSIENGAGLHYILMTEDPLLLADTSCSNYYSVSVDEWKEEIVSAYEQLSDFFYEVSDSAIVQHSILSENVVQVRYENGSSVLINYNDQPVTVGETTIDGMDYCLLK